MLELFSKKSPSTMIKVWELLWKKIFQLGMLKIWLKPNSLISQKKEDIKSQRSSHNSD